MESKVIPTPANQFFDDYAKEHLDAHSWNDFICSFDENYVEEKTFEVSVLFARHHREMQIEAIKENYELEYDKWGHECIGIDPDSIENAYPEDLIK